MTELKDYEEFAEGPLVFPYRGKKYVVPEIGIQEGLKLSGAIAGRDTEFAESAPEELWKLVLGTAYDEMIADNVSADFLNRAGVSALADVQYGREFAIAVWEVGADDPKALGNYFRQKNGNRAQRRSSSTAGARKTPSRASTKGTTSRKRS